MERRQYQENLCLESMADKRVSDTGDHNSILSIDETAQAGLFAN